MEAIESNDTLGILEALRPSRQQCSHFSALAVTLDRGDFQGETEKLAIGILIAVFYLLSVQSITLLQSLCY